MTIEDCLFGPRCVRIKNAGYNDAKFFCVVPFRLTACLRRVAVIHNTSLPQNAAGAQIDRLPFKWQRVPPASIERNPRNSRPNPYFTPIRPYETWPDGIMFLFVLKATTTFCNDQSVKLRDQNTCESVFVTSILHQDEHQSKKYSRYELTKTGNVTSVCERSRVHWTCKLLFDVDCTVKATSTSSRHFDETSISLKQFSL